MSVKMGLIGLGSINGAHVFGYESVGELARIVAVCDTREDVVERRSQELQCKAYTDYQALLDDADVEAVDITLPHNWHYPVAKAALEHGKHVLVEKPMAPTASECAELVELARKQNLTFTVAENTRFVQAYLTVKQILEAGQAGDIRLIRTLIYGSEVDRLSNSALWKGRKDGTVGGVIMDAGPHSFYLLHWLNGPLRDVRASCAKLVPESEVEDHAIVSGTFVHGGLFSTEYTFTAEIPWGERLEVYGSKATLIVDQLMNPPAHMYHGGTDFDGQVLEAVPYDPLRWKVQSIADGVADFVRAVHEGRPTAVNPEDGLYTMRVVERAYESVRAGGKTLSV